jgi:dynein assembly factor 5, axonemal
MLTESELNRTVILLSDPNKITRQKALQALCNELKSSPMTSNDDTHCTRSMSHIVESVLKIFADPAEKNRDLALTYVSMYIAQYGTDKTSFDQCLTAIMPVLVQRLGAIDIVEPSEEIRLKSVTLLVDLCRGDRLALFLNEWINILKHTIVDPYPDVRKLSCELASKLAQHCQDKFHMMSESLIKPLIETMKHQHARVRVEAVRALGKCDKHMEDERKTSVNQ